MYEPDWLDFVIPGEKTSSNFLGEKKAHDGCFMFKRDPQSSAPLISIEKCSAQSFIFNETEACKQFLYDSTYFDETLATKFDLICEKESYKSLLGTILIVGLLVGSLIGGRLGDKFGRKKACFLAMVLMVPTIISAGHVYSYNGKVDTIFLD